MKRKMKYIISAIFIFTMSLLISAFTFKSNPYLSLDKLPKFYNFDLAIEFGDVVGRWGKSYNVEKLNNFIKAYENKTLKNGDMVRITIYSIEGTPVIKDLIFKEEELKLIVDPTRDSSFKKIEEFIISGIITEARDQYITYSAKTTSSNKKYLITVNTTQ